MITTSSTASKGPASDSDENTTTTRSTRFIKYTMGISNNETPKTTDLGRWKDCFDVGKNRKGSPPGDRFRKLSRDRPIVK